MIPLRLLTETVTIKRAATTTDRYGNEQADWVTGQQVNVPAFLEPQAAGATENTNNRSGLASLWTLIVRPGVVIGGRDRVVHDGKTYEVIGPPALRRGIAGPHHIEATLQWVEG